MTPVRIAELLKRFDVVLDDFRLDQISIYIDLLLRWNARVNLTAIRDLEEIVTRHFGESLFAARCLFDSTNPADGGPVRSSPKQILAGPPIDPAATRMIDVGSGAGFPGLAIKLSNPSLEVTLIESSLKKAHFLREAVRALTLTNVNVFPARAETHPPGTGDVVTLRAVEHFERSLLTAAALVTPKGRLGLMIGFRQVHPAVSLVPDFVWKSPIFIPESTSTVVLIGEKREGPHQ